MPTYGQNLKILFKPVPTTGGWAPPIIKVTITDPNTPLEIVAQTVALELAYMRIHGVLSQMNQNLGDIASSHQLTAKKLSSLEVAIGAWAVSKSMQSALLACEASNQIVSNNFFMAQSPNKPVLPPIDQQIETNFRDSLVLLSSSTLQTRAISFVSDQASSISTWIISTDTYKSVTKWLEDAYKTTLAPVVQSVKAKLRAGLGAIGLGTVSK